MSGTSGAGRLNYEMPIITVMPGHKEQSTFAELQQTLNQLGFDSGSALLKLNFKNSGMALEEAMTQITQYFKTEDSTVQGQEVSHMAATSTQSSTQDSGEAALQAAEVMEDEKDRNHKLEPEAMEIDQRTAVETCTDSPTVNSLEKPSSAAAAAALAPAISTASSQPRTVQIFSASSSSTPQAARNTFNENDYLPTVEHAKSHQAALLTKQRNTRLLSDKELEEQEKARQEKINAAAEKGGALRIRMPDGTLIQMGFTKEDTAAALYDFVKSLLEKKKEPFKLHYSGPTGRFVLIPQDDKRLIHDLRFFPNELVTFQWADDASAEARASRKTLSDEWQAKAQTLHVEESVAAASAAPSRGQTTVEGKRKAVLSAEEKESKLKSLLGKGFFKKK